ncbi:uncharacterized protein METZ01_LOCUS217593, partial [marine metagenome]
ITYIYNGVVLEQPFVVFMTHSPNYLHLR